MTQGFDCDVAIVGGGPAGASTALHLVHDVGIRPDRVLVLDKAKFPRDKPCAGAISTFGLSTLRDLGVPLGVDHVPMTGLRILADGNVGETSCELGVVVRRRDFDAHLLEEVRRAGVDVRDGEGVVRMDKASGGFRLETSLGRSLSARYVAACDGTNGTTRRLLGLAEPARKGHLYVLETEPRATDEGVLRGCIDFDLSVVADGLAGYYWDFPTVIEGRSFVSRGIYDANLNREKREVKGSLLRALSRRGVDAANVKLSAFSTRPLVRGSTFWMPRVLFVGEALGIDRATGEGIAQAIVMGRMAARHLARALRTGGTTFEGYEREVVSSTMGRHLLESAWLAEHVYGGSTGKVARHYLLRSAFAREAGAQWYSGESLSLLVKVRLFTGLAKSAMGRALSRP